MQGNSSVRFNTNPLMTHTLSLSHSPSILHTHTHTQHAHTGTSASGLADLLLCLHRRLSEVLQHQRPCLARERPLLVNLDSCV
jgi:hypothetical protein